MVRAVFNQEMALEDLGQAKLGHKSRTKRLVHTAQLLCESAAGRSLPDRLPNRSDYEGALNLVNNPAVCYNDILKPHFQATRKRMLACSGVVLNISDDATLDFSGLNVAFLGPIGNGYGKGFDCHTSIAYDPATGDVLGLTSLILHSRDTDVQIELQRQADAAQATKSQPAPANNPPCSAEPGIATTAQLAAPDKAPAEVPNPKPKRRRRSSAPVPNAKAESITPAVAASTPVAGAKAESNATESTPVADAATTPTDAATNPSDAATISTDAATAPVAKAKSKPAAKSKRRRPDEPAAARHARQSRETRLWVEGSAALGEIPEGKLWVDVSDRASDTWEYLSFMAGKRRYVIRSKHNRVLLTEEGTEEEVEVKEVMELEVEGEQGQTQYLHERLRSLTSVASWEVDVLANKDQMPRKATVCMAWIKVTLKAPKSYKGPDKEPLEVWAIRVWEPTPPAGAKAMEWLLLTNVAISSNEEARERVSWYECRPVVEEYNKAQKTGMSVENLQLQSRKGLEGMIAILSVLAVVLLNLRQQARQPEAKTMPAQEVVPSTWVKVLSMYLYGEQREMSLRQFYFEVAKLGGYLNRRRGAWPGWIVLWRGFTKLLLMVRYELSRGKRGQKPPDL